MTEFAKLLGSVVDRKYHLERRVGAGGMGEVFRATDSRLGRTVALKFLLDSFARDPARRDRFMLEAQAISRLHSPYVATLYDVGEHNGALFLVMEYVDGEPLSSRLARGALPVPKAIAIAAQIAEALAEAHEQGVVHRDVKPSNVMLNRSGQVKVLDFSLAKLFTPERAEPPTVIAPSLTAPGTILGTAKYMSPEQAMGESVDHRTDIFSLGVILYEMLCGVRPFLGDTPVRLAHEIAFGPPPTLKCRGSRVDSTVARIVHRALEKDRAARYQTARDMAADLAALNHAPPPDDTPLAEPLPPRPLVRDAVAVATFANVTRRPEDDWLGTAIAETVTADLRSVKGLSVIDRERVCSADLPVAPPGADPSDPAFAVAAGRAVGAAWVIVGGFQRNGDQLRITARFSDSATGAVLRTAKIDGPVSEVFELEDRVVDELCDGLDLDLARSILSAVARKETESIDAYRAYARGLSELWTGEPDTFERAIAHLAEAVELDRDYSLAWAALGSAYCLKGGFLGERELVREALAFERKAIAIEPTNSMAFEWLSSAHLALGDVEEAVAAAREAMRLDPRRASARAAHGRAYWLGRGTVDAGIRELDDSTALDPNFGYAYIQLALLYAVVGDFERAESASRRAVELQERNVSGTLGLKMVGARARLGYVFYRTHRYEEAVAEYLAERRTIESGAHALRERTLVEIDQKLGAAYLKLGRQEDAATCLERAVASGRERATRRPLDPATSYYVACAHALRGETAEALEALALTAALQPAIAAFRATRDPDLEVLRCEPAFQRLVAPATEGDPLATKVG